MARKKRCDARTERGDQCKNAALGRGKYCGRHATAKATEQVWKGEVPRVETREDMAALLIEVIERVLTGELDTRRANCAALTAKTVLHLLPSEPEQPAEMERIDPADMTTDQVLALIDKANSVSH